MSGVSKNQARIYLAWFLLVLMGTACVFVWSIVLSKGEKKLTVAFLDVGQGDAIFIETPHGNQVLIDGGKGRSVLRELGNRMSFFDRSIDVVIATHPDTDHIGGLPEVFSRFTVSQYLESGVEDEGADNAALGFAVAQEGVETVYARQGMTLALDTNVNLQILFPDRDTTLLEANTGSVVARLTYGDTSFLFTGDSPAGIETYLVSQYGEGLQSDVLKLGHHGSKTSTSEVFLGYVDPTYAIISASCDNSYGHPSPEIIERTERFGIRHMSTCDEGTIVFKSDGKKVERK